MNTGIVEWAAPNSRTPAAISILPIAAEEARRRPLLMTGTFAAVALVALLLGLTLPKKYTSTTTIQIDENTVPSSSKASASNAKLQPRAAEAREIAMGRKVMLDILVTGGWMDGNPNAKGQERLIRDIARRIDIASPRQLPNLVRINYTDNDPLRAFKVTRRLGELIIQESLAAKALESREAYQFIDSQTTQYHQKLRNSQARLTAYQVANPDTSRGSEEESNRRIAELRRSVDLASMDLVNARAQEYTTSDQLSGENPLGVMQSRSSQIQLRVAEMQAERDRLLLNYTEQHPDVIRIQHQMRDMAAELGNGATRSATRLAVVNTGVPGSSALNPLYGELKSRLTEAHSRSAASASRVALGQGLLGEERARNQRIAGSEGLLAELTRNNQVNRDLYEDLLKRRENARVAMNLDIAGQGLSLRTQEPAALPAQPDEGLRLMHVAMAGLVLAGVAPVLLLFGWLRLDPRVRSTVQIEQLAGLPVLGAIPRRPTHRRLEQDRRVLRIACALVLAVPIGYGLVLAATWMMNS